MPVRLVGDRYFLITFAIAITGGGQSEMYLRYMATTLFFAALYPPRSQVLLLLLTLVCYGAVLVADSGRIGAGIFFFRLVMLALVAYMASFLARELKQQMAGHARAAHAAEQRSLVLVGVAEAARAMSTLDLQQLLDAVANAAALVRGVITLGQMLGLTLVAGGVETEKELEALRALGCPQAQGFMIARPLSAVAAERLLRHGPLAGNAMLADGDDTTAA